MPDQGFQVPGRQGVIHDYDQGFEATNCKPLTGSAAGRVEASGVIVAPTSTSE